MTRKSELDVAVERLDVKISTIEMEINSTTKPGSWPGRQSWKTLLRMSQQVVDEYQKQQEKK